MGNEPGYRIFSISLLFPVFRVSLSGFLLVSICFTNVGCNGPEAREGGFTECPKNIPADMSCIPGGEFVYGSDDPHWRDEHPATAVEVSTFLIEKTEVTTAAYQECVKAGACKKAISNYLHMRAQDMPQVKVSWYDARDYCAWKGRRLPTEAEFEKASRGTEGNIYPWGNQKATCELAVIKENGIRGCTADHQPTGSPKVPATRPAGIYGLFDMSGNVHEWVQDWYAADRSKCGVDCLGKDPAGPCGGKSPCKGYSEKVVKGGSWYWDADWARAAKRRAYRPDNNPPHHFGFRCAASISDS
ncbi:MAG: SUMF1/EgtB/PvdO family nonheme iron enzyme [Leptospiraceae bacterium]|nr:SUMF1/EgtB/PvdO family nonheme iron enzyme [Leptospiraceae bacterium]